MADKKVKKTKLKAKYTPVGVIAKVITMLVSLIFGIVAAVMMAYSGYALYDTFYINRAALSSTDLQKYKTIVEKIDTEGELDYSSLDELAGTIEDYVGWVTVFDTRIDYPVVQGKDDLEYAFKDVFGNNAISGSIYLATDNHGDFTDLYSVLYGHHMENGAMFGDIDHYVDEDYFNSHNKGILITRDGIFDFEIFAVVKTHAYEGMIYSVSEQNEERFNAQKEFIRENAYYMNEEILNGTKKILAMSTCASASTDGRIVIFGDMVPRELPLPDRPDKVTEEVKYEDLPGGMRMIDKGGAWALVNLICLLSTVYMTVPLLSMKSKFGRSKMMKKLNEFYEEEYQADRKKFKRKARIGWIVELVLSIASIVLFILTEDMRLPMILIDKWTIWMLALYLAVWLVDVILVRWKRGKQEFAKKAEENRT